MAFSAEKQIEERREDKVEESDGGGAYQLEDHLKVGNRESNQQQTTHSAGPQQNPPPSEFYKYIFYFSKINILNLREISRFLLKIEMEDSR